MQITWNFELTWIAAMSIGVIIWATKITVTMDFIAKNLADIAKTIKDIQADYVSQGVMDREIGKLELRISAAHLRIDELNNSDDKRIP